MEAYLPTIFAGMMGLSLLIYVILDGYDLGIGMLLPFGNDDEQDMMIAAIGPFWDANETWIVFGVGILLVAFPQAHGLVLSTLYLPVSVMLIGLVLRGIAFDFRAKAVAEHKERWNRIFTCGSLLATCAQGWMLGSYITGLRQDATGLLFSGLIALCLPSLYLMLGAAWLLIKSEGSLFDKALRWARRALLPMGATLLLVSLATPLASSTIAAKWFSWPALLQLASIPLISIAAYAAMLWMLFAREQLLRRRHWLLYGCLIVICVLAALGLAYSILPDIVIGRMTVTEAAASPASLWFTFWGAIIVLPTVLVYTTVVYRIFSGKASPLTYD